MNRVVWHTKKNADRRIRAGHPWVFSNELQNSPKGVSPGQLVELRSHQDDFLAYGYGNPHSLIAFRVLERDVQNIQPLAPANLVQLLLRAHQRRKILGVSTGSHRLIHGEADFFPGLIIDHYVLSEGLGHVFSIQAHTAGAQIVVDHCEEVLKEFCNIIDIDFNSVSVLIKNNIKFREREGLHPEPPRFALRSPSHGAELFSILVAMAPSVLPLHFEVDLLNGQKTGFFLDQSRNIHSLSMMAASCFKSRKNIRILDLCSYMGQWSAQLSSFLVEKLGVKIEAHLVDVSENALKMAIENVGKHVDQVFAHKLDVFDGLEKANFRNFDLVICDPPALIKSKKDLGSGEKGYLKLNKLAMSALAEGGLYTTCSCSSLLEEEVFKQILSKAEIHNKVGIQWLYRGGPALDHPYLLSFPEGQYLKCWTGLRI